MTDSVAQVAGIECDIVVFPMTDIRGISTKGQMIVLQDGTHLKGEVGDIHRLVANLREDPSIVVVDRAPEITDA